MVALHFIHLKGRHLVYIFAQEVTISKKKSGFVCFYQLTDLVNKDVEVKIPTPKHWQQSTPVDLSLYAICSLGRKKRLSQSPSLLISGSSSGPQCKGLVSPAARQIYRRKFPPVVCFQLTLITPLES